MAKYIESAFDKYNLTAVGFHALLIGDLCSSSVLSVQQPIGV